jgi:glutamate dehydrogenase (NADP+)
MGNCAPARRCAISPTAAAAEWQADTTPWDIACDIALPCATQNELDGEAAQALAGNGCRFVAEGANMPCTAMRCGYSRNSGIRHAPGKASNAGGVALSGLEMHQNASFISLPYDELDVQLRAIMKRIHQKCCDFGQGRRRLRALPARREHRRIHAGGPRR